MSERLAAGILSVEGYDDIDPQAPLGGPDDGKDILCAKAGRTYVAACYFPNTQQTFAAIKSKFESDLESSTKHSPYGIVFITNQALTLGQRNELERLALENGRRTVLYHLERLRVLLDSPIGYGLRLQFLQIAMSESDQIAFFEASGNRTALLLDQHKEEIQRISRKIDLLIHRADRIVATTRNLVEAMGGDEQIKIDALSDPPAAVGPQLSAALTIPLILTLNRLSATESPSQLVGRLRTFQVWIGGSSPDRAHLQPPPWDKVRELLDALLTRWNADYEKLQSASEDDQLEALAKFHQAFLSIHPFVDGNGRTARTILEQQCIDLFGAADLNLIERGGRYIEALLEADRGDYTALASLIGVMVSESILLSEPASR